jgi:beta-alanine degradation protein BauB
MPGPRVAECVYRLLSTRRPETLDPGFRRGDNCERREKQRKTITIPQEYRMTASRTSQAQPTFQVDNDRVKVTEWRFAPGAETGWHRHGYDYVVVPMTTGKLKLFDGKEERIAELTEGRSYYRPIGVEHNVINANEYEFAFIEVEFKTPG